MSNLIAIEGINIRQDKEGRYSLNDLHKAAGGDRKHEPNSFLRLDSTKELIEEIKYADSRIWNPVESKKGNSGGSNGCKEIVYAYAMWISPAFHLKVIRTFDAVVTGKLKQKATFIEAAKIFRSALGVTKAIGCPKNLAVISANQAVYARTNINLLEELGQTHLIAENQQEQYYTPTDLGKFNKLSGQKINKLLEDEGFQKRIGDKWEHTEKGRKYCIILDTGKKHGSGTPITQLKWLPSVMKLIVLEVA